MPAVRSGALASPSSQRYASRLHGIRSFQVMDLLDRARALEAEGRDVIHMEVGEPDFDTAPAIRAAGVEALEAGRTRYTSALGLPELRGAIARYYRDWHGVDVAPERIVVTAGASGALVLLGALLIEPGDGVLMADPCYPCNKHFPRLVGGLPQLVAADAASGYQLDADAAARAWQASTRGMLLASPANPTGGVLSRVQLEGLVELARERGAWAIVDEIYQGLTYPPALEPLPAAAGHGDVPRGRVGTALALADDVFVVNSFSKYFGMTGWRLGWIVAPPDAVPHLERLAQNFYIAASTPAQHAALAALAPETMAVHEVRRRAFCERRNRLVAGLRELGMDVPVVPEGAFYVYADVSPLGARGFAFCRELLERHAVAATPGSDFGEYRAEAHVRFAYTAELDRIDAALARIAQALAEPA